MNRSDASVDFFGGGLWKLLLILFLLWLICGSKGSGCRLF